MNHHTWIVAALLTPLVTAQHGAQAPAPKSAPAAAGIDALHALGTAGARHALEQPMLALADSGDGRATLWCLRHSAVFGGQRVARTLEGFTRLVREHAGERWLQRPENDPTAALEGCERALRHALAASLEFEVQVDPAARGLALYLRAAALAPREAREAAFAAQALALLDELRALEPDGPWSARADLLAWRLEHLAPGGRAPELVLHDVDGNELVLDDWLDGDVLVDVWRADDPERAVRAAELQALVERVRRLRPERTLRVLALGLGADEGTFRRELEELELPWPTAFEDAAGGPARHAWRLDGAPARLWIDGEGRVRAAGATLGELEALLLEPPVPAESVSDEPIRAQPNEGTSDAAGRDARQEE